MAEPFAGAGELNHGSASIFADTGRGEHEGHEGEG
jgi:hypothetical protein